MSADAQAPEPGTWAHTLSVVREMPIEEIRAEIASRQAQTTNQQNRSQ